MAGAGDRGTIDVLVLYTPRAASRQDMDLLVAESMAQLDRASRMLPGDRFGVTFRLAGIEEVDYREGADLGGRPRPAVRASSRASSTRCRRSATSTAPTSSI